MSLLELVVIPQYMQIVTEIGKFFEQQNEFELATHITHLLTDKVTLKLDSHYRCLEK